MFCTLNIVKLGVANVHFPQWNYHMCISVTVHHIPVFSSPYSLVVVIPLALTLSQQGWEPEMRYIAHVLY